MTGDDAASLRNGEGSIMGGEDGFPIILGWSAGVVSATVSCAVYRYPHCCPLTTDFSQTS